MNKELAKPQISAYESILLIFSELVLKGRTVLRQDNLVTKLFDYKNQTMTKPLFEDIAFDDHLDTITSIDVENSLVKLQTYGAIGKLNPAYEKIVVYISREEAEKFISNYDKHFVLAAEKISEVFLDERVKGKKQL